MTSSENTKNPQVETSLFSDKKAETIKVAAELCNKKFSDFAHAKAAQKCTVGIYTTTENLEALATITTQLAALAAAPLDIQTITAFFAFIEKYGHLSSLDQLKERLAAAQFNENIATDMSVEQGIKILFLYQTLKKRNPTSGTNFQKRIHHVAPGESVTQFINRVEEKIQTGTLVTTKVITTPVPLHSEPKLQSPVNPFTERVTIKAETDDSLQVELFIQNNESIYILSLEKGSTPQLIKGKGKLQHQIKKGSILKVETENEHNLFRLTEKQTLEMVREHSQKGPETKLLKFAFDSLWKWHQFEFTSINTELIETLETAIAGFEKRENSGFYKDQVKKVLAKLELEGFPKRIAVEILDRVQGISTGGWLLEPSFFDYLEKKKNLSPEQWHKLLSVASNREDLLTLIEEWSQEGIFSPLEKMNFSNSIEQAIPGDNIEHFVQMFTTIFESTTSGTCNEKLLQYSYHCKALPTEKHPSFETFSRQVFHIISLSKHESLETSQAEAENKLRFKKQELTLRWLYAKITGSFGELHHAHIGTVTRLPLKEKVLVNAQPTTKLRYDKEQEALVIKTSLDETLPPELHRYLQMRTQQATFSREYGASIADRAEYQKLNELLKLFTKESKEPLSASKTQQALFRFAVSDETLREKIPGLSESVTLTCEHLAKRIVEEPSQSILFYLQKHFRTMDTFKTKAIHSGITESELLKNPGLITELLEQALTTFTENSDPLEERFQRTLTTILWVMASRLPIKTKSQGGEQQKIPFTEHVTQSVLHTLFADATTTVSGLHGWGAGEETTMPFTKTLTKELGGSATIVAHSYMGAGGSNLLPIEGLPKPISVAGMEQDMISYALQYVSVMAELDGTAEEGLITGHSMGGYVTLQAALAQGSEWDATRFLALEPVLSETGKEIPNPEKPLETIKHYIALLGTSKGEDDRSIRNKIAAYITNLVTDPNSKIPDGIQAALVSLGKILVNEAVYYSLVRNSDPRAALTHYVELITYRDSFHTHVTPILKDVRSLTKEEKIYLATTLKEKVKIVIAKNDDVLKHQFALWELLEDPELEDEHKEALAEMLLLISGNHYGHLEQTVYEGQDNPQKLSNQTRVAQSAKALLDS